MRLERGVLGGEEETAEGVGVEIGNGVEPDRGIERDDGSFESGAMDPVQNELGIAELGKGVVVAVPGGGEAGADAADTEAGQGGEEGESCGVGIDREELAGRDGVLPAIGCHADKTAVGGDGDRPDGCRARGAFDAIASRGQQGDAPGTTQGDQGAQGGDDQVLGEDRTEGGDGDFALRAGDGVDGEEPIEAADGTSEDDEQFGASAFGDEIGGEDEAVGHGGGGQQGVATGGPLVLPHLADNAVAAGAGGQRVEEIAVGGQAQGLDGSQGVHAAGSRVEAGRGGHDVAGADIEGWGRDGDERGEEQGGERAGAGEGEEGVGLGGAGRREPHENGRGSGWEVKVSLSRG